MSEPINVTGAFGVVSNMAFSGIVILEQGALSLIAGKLYISSPFSLFVIHFVGASHKVCREGV